MGVIFDDSSSFDWRRDVIPWLVDHYQVYLVPLILYPLVVNKLPHSSAKRPSLKPLFFVWNLFQFSFSACCLLNVAPILVKLVADHGLGESICLTRHEFDYREQMYGRWIFYFMLSKVLDMGDTFLMMLTGKPVGFLHWYHHWVTMLMAFVQSMTAIETMLWVCSLNMFVHTCMYFHYSVASVTGLKGNRVLTLMQLAQMLFGTYVTLYHLAVCDTKVKDYAGILVYVIYAFLFFSFFFQRYKRKAE